MNPSDPNAASTQIVAAGLDQPVLRQGRAAAQAAKRAIILAAARQVFLRLGYDGASMNDIATEARVSKPTLYVYFDSKETLFAGLVEENVRVLPEIGLELDATAPNIEATLLRYGVRLMEKITAPSHIAFMRMVIGAAGKFPQVGAMAYQAGPRYAMEQLAGYLQACSGRGALLVHDPEVAARSLFELIQHWHLRRLLLGVDATPDLEDIERSVAAGVRLFLRAHQRPGA